MFKHFSFIVLSILISTAFSNAQIVNIESLRFLADSNGFRGQLQATAEYEKKELEKYTIGTGILSAYKHNNHIVFTNLAYEFGQVDSLKNADNFFAHLRYNYQINPFLITEAFLQTKQDEFLNISTRELYGAGLRFKLKKNPKIKFFAGVTGMFEHEEITTGQINDLLRMSNYLTFTINQPTTQFNTTMYYQPAFNEFDNYRVYWSNNLGLKVWRKMAFILSFNIEYDSRRPLGVSNTVIESKGSLSYSF